MESTAFEDEVDNEGLLVTNYGKGLEEVSNSLMLPHEYSRSISGGDQSSESTITSFHSLVLFSSGNSDGIFTRIYW